MAVGYFTDKAHKPSKEELNTILGAACAQWDRLTHLIDEKYMIPSELSFGGKNYGWNLWYRKSGKSLVSLYPQQDSFVAQVVLGKKQMDKALSLELGENVSSVLGNTPMLHDGCWLFITARSVRDVEDIHQLLALKRKPPRKRKVLK